MGNNDERKSRMVTTVSIKYSIHRYGWHTMETETGIECIQMYTAFALKYTARIKCIQGEGTII